LSGAWLLDFPLPSAVASLSRCVQSNVDDVGEELGFAIMQICAKNYSIMLIIRARPAKWRVVRVTVC
jgi:hypothetical protein